MDILELDLFSKMSDSVKTEQTIYEQLLERMDDISDDVVYVALPIAWIINCRGEHIAQQYINDIVAKYSDRKLIFVCQHIKVNVLNFHDHMVFTPHATVLDNFYSMPHFSANVRNKDLPKFDERKLLASFQGAFMTHWTRTALQNGAKNKDGCIVNDTGNWHFQKDPRSQFNISKQYTDMLRNTKVALCPRGTGPSSIRLWESMAHGCVPMLISDYLKMPLSNVIPWENLILRVPEGDASKFIDYIPEENELREKADNCLSLYNDFFCNKRLYTSITNVLKGFSNV